MTRTRLARGIVSGAKTGSGTSLVGSDDFGSYSTGSAPPGYTAEKGNATLNVASSADAESGGNLLEISYSSGDEGRTGVTKDSIGSQGDVEVTARILADTGSSENSPYMSPMLRASGFGTSLNLYRADPLNNNDPNTNENSLQLSNYANDSFSSLNLNAAGFAFTTEPLLVRFQVIGGELKGRIWLSTDTEPSSWTVTYSDTNPRPDGKVGFNQFIGSGDVPTTRFVDWWGWSLDPTNESAPLLS